MRREPCGCESCSLDIVDMSTDTPHLISSFVGSESL